MIDDDFFFSKIGFDHFSESILLTSGVRALLKALLFDGKEFFFMIERDFDLLNVRFIENHDGALLDSEDFKNFLASLVK